MTTPTKAPPRFSLRFLLLITAACAPPLALFRANAELGVTLGLVIAGLLLVWVGTRTMRPAAVVVGVLMLVATVGLAFVPQQGVAWVGRSKLDVFVVVLDATSLERIQGATIEVLFGPHAPLVEGPQSIDVRRDFEVELPAEGPVTLTTDQKGMVMFKHRFTAAGMDRPYSSSGSVHTGYIWLRVTAPGYTTTHLPLDRQSSRPRDLNDKSPICVTVPLGKK